MLHLAATVVESRSRPAEPGRCLPDFPSDSQIVRACFGCGVESDVVGRGGFEPPKRNATDLQSAPFGHSGTSPTLSDPTLGRVEVRGRGSPLQALTLLNDAMFLELARGMARQVLAGQTESRERESAVLDEARATTLLRRLITRPPRDQELQAVLQYYHAQRKRLAARQ